MPLSFSIPTALSIAGPLSVAGATTLSATTSSLARVDSSGVISTTALQANLSLSAGTLSLSSSLASINSITSAAGQNLVLAVGTGGTGLTITTSTLAATFAGNLTVSGTGTSTFSGLLAVNKVASGTLATFTDGTVSLSAYSSGTAGYFGTDGAHDLQLTTNGTSRVTVAKTTGNVTLTGNLTVSGGSIFGSGSAGSGALATVSPGSNGITTITRTSINGAGLVGVLQVGSDAKTIGDGVQVLFIGKDSGSADQVYASLSSSVLDPTAGSEDGDFVIRTMTAGSLATAATFVGANTTLAGNLTVSGTGLSTFAGGVSVKGNGGSNEGLYITTTNGTYYNYRIGTNIGDVGRFAIQKAATAGASATDFETVVYFDNSKDAYFSGKLITGTPSGGTSGAWKLGIKVDATVAFDTTKYIQLDIGGTLYKLALAS